MSYNPGFPCIDVVDDFVNFIHAVLASCSRCERKFVQPVDENLAYTSISACVVVVISGDAVMRLLPPQPQLSVDQD
jgi:hypothetical protein